MTWGAIRLLMAWLTAAIYMAAAGPALAAPFAPGPVCHAAAQPGETYAALAGAPGRWNCSPSGWSVKTPVSFLRFDLQGQAAPAELRTRLTRFASMTITAIGPAGSVTHALTPASFAPSTSDWLMSTALPRPPGRVEAIVLRVDGARHAGMLSDARLMPKMGDTPSSLRHEALIAVLCGMLCMPLLFNFAFYRVLRERFLLWHAASTALMLTHTMVTSGLINRFLSPDLIQLSIASALSVGGGIIAASAFSADLIEPGKLGAIHRRLLRGLWLWVVPSTLFYLFAGGVLRPLAAPVYLASFLAPMALFLWTMVVAWRRGSRAVNYQIAAWIPVMITAAIRIASGLGLGDAPVEMLVAQHYAMGFEVIITSLGVFDRLLAIRRERDLALADLRIFEERSERDPLTGLFNRRGIEKRFAALHAEGFRAMALIDLDRFKLVNDTHGHIMGDAVLRATAEALDPDDDTLAIRMGGEEFLLLLRGRDLSNRAERRRQAIATRVAGNVTGLGRVVTASMGMIELPADIAMKADFRALYAQCDRLLYEAKHTGRNRTMRETLRSFGTARAA